MVCLIYSNIFSSKKDLNRIVEDVLKIIDEFKKVLGQKEFINIYTLIPFFSIAYLIYGKEKNINETTKNKDNKYEHVERILGTLCPLIRSKLFDEDNNAKQEHLFVKAMRGEMLLIDCGAKSEEQREFLDLIKKGSIIFSM